MTTGPEPEPEERDASLDRRAEEEQMRYPGHGTPDEARENVGLTDERAPEPDGAPLPPDADRSRPAPVPDEE